MKRNENRCYWCGRPSYRFLCWRHTVQRYLWTRPKKAALSAFGWLGCITQVRHGEYSITMGNNVHCLRCWAVVRHAPVLEEGGQ